MECVALVAPELLQLLAICALARTTLFFAILECHQTVR